MRKVVVVILGIPLFFFGCSPNNVTVDESLGRYFDSAGVKGSFGLFDNGHGHFTIYNLSRYSDSFYTPGATFDILQALVAIQTGVVKDEKGFGTGGDTGQVVFSQLANELGKDTLKKWIDSLQYGNKAMSSDVSTFWQDNTLKINCDEQLGLLKKLYFNQLPFFARTQEIVRRMMSAESNSVYRFCYKTAQERRENGDGIGWVMGWVEENKHPYFFVVNLESADPTKDLRETGLVIVKKILHEQGFFEGKK
ncbi:MAG TPA: penicillin-binding transpeptidase domain-containing protein [Puia sp.]|nr:penicillin-binding transpeptidase domain-containing protein [Puia sp.]